MAAYNKGKAAAKLQLLSNTNNGTYNIKADAEKNTIALKIIAARERRDINQAEFCRRLKQYGVEVGQAAVSKWERGQSVPNAYQMIAITYALDIEEGMGYFGDNSTGLELNAQGLKKLQEYKADLIATGKYRPVKSGAAHQYPMVKMRMANLKVSAGTGAFLDEGDFELMSFPETAVPAGADFGIWVSGNSMEPVYHDGQIVWVQESEVIRPGEVGIFSYDGNGYLKMYSEQEPEDSLTEEFLNSDGVLRNQPVLVSFNEDYAPIEVSPNVEFRIFGRVLN